MRVFVYKPDLVLFVQFLFFLVFVEEPLTDVDVGRSQVMVSSCLPMTIGIGQGIRGYCRLRSYPIDRWPSGQGVGSRSTIILLG